jgi:hypothetical protein
VRPFWARHDGHTIEICRKEKHRAGRQREILLNIAKSVPVLENLYLVFDRKSAAIVLTAVAAVIIMFGKCKIPLTEPSSSGLGPSCHGSGPSTHHV